MPLQMPVLTSWKNIWGLSVPSTTPAFPSYSLGESNVLSARYTSRRLWPTLPAYYHRLVSEVQCRLTRPFFKILDYASTIEHANVIGKSSPILVYVHLHDSLGPRIGTDGAR